jgi:hypothetical protein
LEFIRFGEKADERVCPPGREIILELKFDRIEPAGAEAGESTSLWGMSNPLLYDKKLVKTHRLTSFVCFNAV